MILKPISNKEIVIGGLESIPFEIDHTSPLLFEMLRKNIYSDPIGAICREISSNAKDANRESGTDVPIPKEIINKLKELYDNKQEDKFNSLLRFWKKLLLNPSKQAQLELFDFITATNVSITLQGDILLEKGVNQKRDGVLGELVDIKTGNIDNSIGMEVMMPREKVDSNSNNTCSHGLHVGAPDFVRKYYGESGIIITVVVNPKDVVSIPKEYTNGKMRVCRYNIIGFSDKTSKNKSIPDFKDYFKTPDDSTVKSMAYAMENPVTDKDIKQYKEYIQKEKGIETQEQDKLTDTLNKNTAKEVVQFVKDLLKYEITFSLKSKKSIVNKAYQLIQEHPDKERLTLILALSGE